MTLAATTNLQAQLVAPAALDEAGIAELTLTNAGTTRDMYRLTVETEFHQHAWVEPATVRLEPSASRTVTVASQAPVVVRVYSELSGQSISEAYLGR